MKQPGLPSVNAGPNAEQVRKAKETFAASGGKSSLPAASILYGPPVEKQSRKELPLIVQKDRSPSPTRRAGPSPGSGSSVPKLPAAKTPFIPNLGLGIAKIRQEAETHQKVFEGDNVGYVHGVKSSALPSISQHGLLPIKERLDAFAGSEKLKVDTEEQRAAVAKRFHDTMKTGEKGNTLDAWVKSPEQPVAKGVSVVPAHKARDVLHYANLGEGEFPAVLGLSSGVATQSHAGIDHPLTQGRVSPRQIEAVYVPGGRSKEADAMLHPSLRGRARSFPDLFNQSKSPR